jgi:hypothetical protein
MVSSVLLPYTYTYPCTCMLVNPRVSAYIHMLILLTVCHNFAPFLLCREVSHRRHTLASGPPGAPGRYLPALHVCRGADCCRSDRVLLHLRTVPVICCCVTSSCCDAVFCPVLHLVLCSHLSLYFCILLLICFDMSIFFLDIHLHFLLIFFNYLLPYNGTRH